MIDIGANTGQFAQMIHEVIPSAQILSFEPLSDCFSELKFNLNGIPGAQAFNIALGAKSGDQVINKSSFSPSSSILNMADVHKKIWPQSADCEQEKIRVERLDDVFREKNLEKNVMIKIDVQGYEKQVIEGGVNVFSRATIAVVEVSFTELYQDQPLFDDIYDVMMKLGFRYAGNIEQFSNPNDGRPLFADAIFENIRLLTT